MMDPLECDNKWYEAQEQAAVDRGHATDNNLDSSAQMAYEDELAVARAESAPREDEYDPNSDAFDREMESRIAGERKRQWDLRPVMRAIVGSEPPASDTPQEHPPQRYGGLAGYVKDHIEGRCKLCAVDRSLKAHVVAFTQAVDSLEAVVQRLKRFLQADQ